MNISKLIDEYPQDYCDNLEFIYGEGMMSEGGTEFIDRMFHGIDLQEKSCLDIGFGLGGAAFHLAETHRAVVTGIEINPRMVKLANKKRSKEQLKMLSFYCYDNYPVMPFEDESFDIVYSKGVLVHAEEKERTLQEAFRVLKSGGTLVIEDWLSPEDDVWAGGIKRMCEVEDLSLFAVSETTYLSEIMKAGFVDAKTENCSEAYSQFNFDAAEKLKNPIVAEKFKQHFNEALWRENIECYQLIGGAMRAGDLIVMNITAKKPYTTSSIKTLLAT